MADLDQYYSTSIDASGDSKESHLDSKLEFSEDEKNLITRMYKLVGEMWSLIAGRIPGRTAVEIEKYWTCTYIPLINEISVGAGAPCPLIASAPGY